MKSLIAWIYINPQIYARLNAAEKNLIQILALSIPASSLVAGIVFFYSIQLLLESNFLAFVGSSFIAYLLFLHDSTLLAESGKGRAIFRLFLSFLVALVVAVPLKIKFMGEGLEERFLADAKEYNITVEKDLMDEKQLIYNGENEVMQEVKKAGGVFDRTGKSQALVEARRMRDAFLATKDERIAQLERMYESKKRPLKATNLDLAGYYFTHMFSRGSSKELFVNLTVFILLLLIEALPPIVRLKLEDGKYVSKVIHKHQLKDKTDKEVETIEVDILQMDGLENLPDKLEKVRLWKELEKVSDDDFKDTDRLINLTKQFNKKKETKQTPPPPPPPRQKAKPKNNEYPEFDYNDLK